MKTLSLLLFILFMGLACGNQEQTKEASVEVSAKKVEVKPFQNEDGTWGYDISMEGKSFIHQPHQPAIGGNKGFGSEDQAMKVGELVADKISRGIMPPSVTAAEIDSLIHLNK